MDYSYFDFLQDTPSQEAPSVAPAVPTIRPAKTPEEIQKAREKVQSLLDEAKDYEGLVGEYPEPKYPTTTERTGIVDLAKKSSSLTGPALPMLSEIVSPTGKTTEDKRYVPVEDPRKTEYALLAKNRRDKADRIAREHGFSIADFDTSKPQIEDIPEHVSQISPNEIVDPQKQRSTTLESLMEANGVPQEDLYKGVLDLSKKLGLTDIDAPVNFGVGVSQVLSLPELSDVRKEFENEAQNLSGGGMRYGKPSKQGVPEKSLSPADYEREQRKLDYKQLGDLDEMHSWQSVLGYVLLSMVIGPHLAALFFRWNAKDKAQLRVQIQDRSERIKQLQHDEEMKQQQAQHEQEFNRRLAAESMMHRQDKAIDLNARFKEQLFLHAFDSMNRAQQHAAASGNSEMRKFINAQRDNFSRAMSLANLADKKAKDLLDRGDTKEAERSKQEAQLRYQEAQKIDEYVTELNRRLYGAESESESEPEPAAAER